MKSANRKSCTVNCIFPILVVGILMSPNNRYPASIKKPRDIAVWFKAEGFTYQADEVQSIKSPEDTFRNRGGDCEDFAILVGDILDTIGYKNYLVAIYWDEDDVEHGHAICIVEENGRWNFFSNTKYYEIKASYILTPVNNYQPDWTRILFFNKAGWVIKRLNRSDYDKNYRKPEKKLDK